MMNLLSKPALETFFYIGLIVVAFSFVLLMIRVFVTLLRWIHKFTSKRSKREKFLQRQINDLQGSLNVLYSHVKTLEQEFEEMKVEPAEDEIENVE